MTSEVKLSKAGNSLVLRIPKFFLENLELNQDSRLKLSIKNKKLIVEKKKNLKQMCESINEKNLNRISAWEKDIQGEEW